MVEAEEVMRDNRNPFVGNIRLAGRLPLPTYMYCDPRTMVQLSDPKLAALLDRRLNGEPVDLRKHLTGR
jgi:hypothetical protein